MKKTANRLGLGVALLLLATASVAADLTAQPCSAAASLQSPKGTANQLLTVNNRASEPISVAWLDTNGREGGSSAVQSSKSAFMKVAPGWAMVVRDARGQCVAVYVMATDGGAFTIRDPMLPGRAVSQAPSPSAPVASSRPLADNEFQLPDNSIWSINGAQFQRVEPAPALTVSMKIYAIDIPCSRGRPVTGYPRRPPYLPPSFVGATPETVRDGATVSIVCADIPGGVFDAALTWRQPLSPADNTSFRYALTFLTELIRTTVAVQASTLALFSPSRGQVGLLSTTGRWSFVTGQNQANETLLMQEWPAEPLMMVKLNYSPGTQRCDQTGLEGSATPKPDWVPSTFYARASRGDGRLLVCADVRGHVLMATIVEQATYGPADFARLGAFLLMVTGALSGQ